MKNLRICLCVLLVTAAPLFALAGCGSKSGAPAATQPKNNAAASTPPTSTNTPTPTATISTADSLATDGAAPTDAAAPTATPFSYSEGIDENGFWAGVRALDYVDMFAYKGMVISNDVRTVTDDQLQSQINSMLDSYSTSNQITDRAVADGDTVNIDYVGSIDGVEFQGGSTQGQGTEVTIGVTSYIDDFLQQLIGHKPGETVNVNVTFPADYQQTDLAGKDALFVTKINYIADKVKPELTDEFVNTNLASRYGWTTVAQMKDGMRAELQKEAIQQYIQQYFADNVTVKSVPDTLINYKVNSMIAYYQNYAAYNGVTLEEFLSGNFGYTSVDQLIEANKTTNENGAKYYLICQAIAEDLKYSVSDADLTNYFTKYVGSGDYSSYEQQYGLPYLKLVVLDQKVIDYIVDNSVVS
ncbi:MAG: FKBP-type peptidyl-prolyl cis-trans isomerase [Firmicutes bacterium]|nr:FKBP-type peptidyl-prolyl cis-trans isomerase [Bacillota bacterium]